MSAPGVSLAVSAFAIVLAFRRCGVQRAAWYQLPGVLLWFGLTRAGIHPTVAGAILGLMMPVRNPRAVADRPLARLRDALHPWVAFGVMPLFALANAGVELHGLVTSAPIWSLGTAVALGLVVGKPIGIFGITMLCVKFRLCALPSDVRSQHLLVLSCLGGIGLTMSIFLADLAFPQAELLSLAKAAVLLGSIVAGCCGLLLGRLLLSPVESDVKRVPRDRSNSHLGCHE